MQNRYVGDIGDFGKYELLRIISGSGLTLGVNWYLAPDEAHNSDGKYTSYLHKENYKDYDEELYFALKYIVEHNMRDVHSIQNIKILPPNTIFYDNVLDFSDELDYRRRQAIRKSWHDSALNKLKDCDVVFLDPDNGLEVPSVSLTGRKGNKYLGLDELKDYYKLGKSIIFYNHRERKAEKEYLKKFRNLQNDASFYNAKWLGLKFCRGTIRDYIFVIHKEQFCTIKTNVDILLSSKWNSEFSELAF